MSSASAGTSSTSRRRAVSASGRATPAEVTPAVVLAAMRALGLSTAAQVADLITRGSGGVHHVSGRAVRHFAERNGAGWVGDGDGRRYFAPVRAEDCPLLCVFLADRCRTSAPSEAGRDVDTATARAIRRELLDLLDGVLVVEPQASQLLSRYGAPIPDGGALEDLRRLEAVLLARDT